MRYLIYIYILLNITYSVYNKLYLESENLYGITFDAVNHRHLPYIMQYILAIFLLD